MQRIHDIHRYARQHLKVASDQMKARYNRLTISVGVQDGDEVSLYRRTRIQAAVIMGRSVHGH
jgi:hypothetical protein